MRKSYRCQPGKRRDVVTALQKMEAAGAESGYPRGRYVLVETRAPGEPDLEVEFTFESYGEMERLERAMRERVSRYLRDGGATGQEYLLEPSATKHLLLVEVPPGGPAGRANNEHSRSESAGVRERSGQGAASEAPGISARGSGGAQRPPGGGGAARSTAELQPEPPDLTFDEDEELEEPPEPDIPPPPEIPDGMTREQFQQEQLKKARNALQSAEKTAGTTRQPPRSPDRR